MKISFAPVDAAALNHNLRQVVPGARPAPVMAVMKANAYGHGLVPRRKRSCADGFAVARLDEGLALRAAGFTNRILLLEGVFNAGSWRRRTARFELMVHSFQQFDLLDGFAGMYR